MNLLIAILGYYAVWFLSVLGKEGWWGGAASLAFLVLLMANPKRPGVRWFLLPPAGFLFGTLVDGMLASTGALVFTHETFLLGLPLWMPMLWAAFAGAIPILLGAFRDRLLLIAVLGAIGGPLTYYSAAKLGAVSEASTLAYAVVAVEWAVFPVLALLWSFPRESNRAPALA